MSEVIALGYLGFHARDVDEWIGWATDILGLQVAEPPPDARDGHAFLRMDERAWRFAVEPADAGGLAYTGWEVSGPAALEALGRRLSAAGVAVKEDPATARLRQVDELIRCSDPDGLMLEFFCGAHIPSKPFVSPRGVRFVTGDLGLGHILQTVSDAADARRFYIDLLGFRTSDYIWVGSTKVHFTRVNGRHHSLAFAEVEGASAELGHFMVEVDSLDAVGMALDRVNSGPTVLTETLGKHTNDHMVSFYMRNPSGSQTEYGFAGRIVDEDTWTVSSYDATAFWGHKVPGSEYSESGAVSPRETT